MSCEYKTITLQPTKSLKVTRTNTLHQFDTEGIIGLPSPVGKVPIVFYLKETCRGGRRGIIYYDDYDSVCYMYPEYEHSEWCSQPYDMKYDHLKRWEDEKSHGFTRQHGIFNLWVDVWRHWYNGKVYYRPEKKLKSCGSHVGGYPTVDESVTVETKKTRTYTPKKTKHRSCNCGKGN